MARNVERVVGLFLLHAIRRVSEEVRERHDDFLRLGIECDGERAEEAAHESDGDREREGAGVSAEGAGKRAEEPVERAECGAFLAGFVNLAVATRDEVFEEEGVSGSEEKVRRRARSEAARS